MSLQTLGYIGLRTKNLEDWTAYASRFLGMQLVDKSRGTPRSAWTTRSSAWWCTRMPATRRASSAGRSRTPPRSTPMRRDSNATRFRSRAAPARSPRSARSAT